MKDSACPCVRLLLVDDEKGYIDILSNRFHRRGIEAVTAYSGTEALQVLRRERFHAMVLDLKMEDMDGIEVLKIVRKMAPGLPVIILTGHGSRTAAKDGMALGAFGYLTKPCEFQELMEKIRLARNAKQTHNGELSGNDIQNRRL